MAQWLTNPTRNHGVAGLIPGLAQWVAVICGVGRRRGSGVAVSCGVGRRRGSDVALLWFRRRPAATALIRPLAWEPPQASSAALKAQKKKKKKIK